VVLYMQWLEDKVCLAFKGGYQLLDVPSGQFIDVHVPLEAGVDSPTMCVVGTDVLLNASSNLSIFVDSKSYPVGRSPVQWLDPISSLHLCGDYVLGISSDTGGIQVVSGRKETVKVVQTISLSDVDNALKFIACRYVCVCVCECVVFLCF
jgi:hypothetical protein